MKKIVERYAEFIVRSPHFIVIAVALFTLISFIGMSNVRTEGMSYKDMIPDNVEVMNAFNYIADEFGTSGESISLVMEAKPKYVNSNEVRDIRDPRVVMYSDILEKKIKRIEGVVSVSGFQDILKKINSGQLPKTRSKIIELMKIGVTINQSSFNVPELFSRFSTGLEGIGEGMAAEERIIDGIIYGLNGSSMALRQIQHAILSTTELLNQEQGLGQVGQISSLIDQIEALVQQSNATQYEKMEIIGYLEGLKEGLNEMSTQVKESQEGLSKLSISLNSMAISIGNISSGLKEMENSTLLLKNITHNTKEGISGIKSGLDEAVEYLELYGGEGKKKDNKPVKINLFKNYVSNDYTTSIMKINLAEMSKKKEEEIVDDIKQLISETEKPPGLEVGITGSLVVSRELKQQVIPTMQKTSLFSLIGIFIVVFLLFLSLRYGIISLLAIGFGIMWVYGIAGLLGVSINSTMSGALSMIMGIGIDFGIQVVNRFREEMKRHKLEKAMKVTLSNVFTPMLVTTLAALIGFRAMSLGQLTLLADLGNMMSLGILSCFIAATTLIPAVLVIGEKLRIKKR